MEQPETKWCPHCQAEKPISDFHVTKCRYDGLSPLCAEHSRIAHRESAIRLRIQFIQQMGGACERCGFNDWRALQVDHVNGDGRIERVESVRAKAAFRRKVLAERDRYMLLCANCNWIKKYEQNETKGIRIYVRTPPTRKLKGVGKGNTPANKAALARARTSEHQRAAAKMSWANQTPEQREARIAKIRAKATGRKLVDGHWVHSS